MKKSKLFKILACVLAMIMIAALPLSIITQLKLNVEATSATTYTHTVNSDGLVIRSQDGYIPESTFNRINLKNPQDMVIDEVNENEYIYVLNQDGTNSYLTKLDTAKLTNDPSSVTQISLSTVYSMFNMTNVNPFGLWLQTTTVNNKTQKELYIADKTAEYKSTYYGKPDEEGKRKLYTYHGAIIRIPFDSNDELDFVNSSIIHEPTEITSITTESFGTYNAEVVTPAFGATTLFRPTKVAVDSYGNVFIASEGTSDGMIQLTYSGDFVSFFVVNTVKYNFLYQLIKKIGTEEQLEKLNYDKPTSFANVFVDKDDLVYSVSKEISTVFDKYSTSGSSILETAVTFSGITNEKNLTLTDCYVTDQGLIYICLSSGLIYVFSPDGKLIFYFGSSVGSLLTTPRIVGFFEDKALQAIVVDKSNRIWAIDSKVPALQTFITTAYSDAIFGAITKFNEQDYEGSQQSWEDVLTYDSLSVLANDGLGKAYYYNKQYQESLSYFATSKNRSLYSNVFWELRNTYLQQNLSTILIILISLIVLIIVIKYIFENVSKLKEFKDKIKNKIVNSRIYKDLTVGFRIIKKPTDTFYELKVNRRGSIWGATLHYILALVAILLNTYCYALPFQTITINTISVSTVLFGAIAVIFVFILCNYLVSAINDGEGTFKDIYKFTGYSLLPIIILLPISVGISYGLTLNEQVVVSLFKTVAFWGTGIMLVVGILETHNYSFGQTVKNVLLTIVFMVLFAIICVVVFVMVDQIATLIETIWKEVKLRAKLY